MRMVWQVEAPAGKRFLSIFLKAGRVMAYRDDGVLLEFDPASGKAMHQYSTLWRPDNAEIAGETAYFFSSGQAYAIKLPK